MLYYASTDSGVHCIGLDNPSISARRLELEPETRRPQVRLIETADIPELIKLFKLKLR
jgi:hypothetical protein